VNTKLIAAAVLAAASVGMVATADKGFIMFILFAFIAFIAVLYLWSEYLCSHPNFKFSLFDGIKPITHERKSEGIYESEWFGMGPNNDD
jgi:hypothetical protein